MNVAALPLYRELREKLALGDIKNAKQGLAKLWLLAPHWVRSAHLEAYIHRDERNYIAELKALSKMFSMIDCNNISDRILAADGYSLRGSALALLGEIPSAVESFLLSSDFEINPTHKLSEVSNAIFAAHYAADFSADGFNALYGKYRGLLRERPRYKRLFYHHDKIRLGFLSGNFRQQPLVHFLLPLIKYLPRDRFVLYAYDATEQKDACTELLKKYFDCWQDVSTMDDATIAEKIRGGETDILLELDGHTKGNRLGVLSYSSATVQIFGLGYMGSTGLYDTDYFITDELCLTSAKSQNFLTEKPLLIPDCHLCYDPLEVLAPLPIPTADIPCKTVGHITFGCFNNFSKVTDELLSAWGKILQAVPGSHILLKHRIFDSREGTDYVLARMERAGIDAGMVGLQGLSADYLSVYNKIDIALDTYPYTGALTTCEALSMGVPVISCYGERPGSAFGRTLLAAAGLGELATPNMADYVSLAVNLATDMDLLLAIRRALPQKIKQSVLCQGKNYALKVGKALLAAYEQERKVYGS